MVSHVALVPDDVFSTAVLERLDCVKALCALASTSRRFRQLSSCDTLWKTLWTARWGEPVGLTRRAASLAGGFKALFGSKDRIEKASAPWTKPCPEELKASVEKLTNRLHGDAQQVSVVFLVDGSGSVNAEEFDAMLAFVLDASTQLRDSVQNCQVSVVQFSNDVRVEAALAPVDLEALRKVTREMVRMNGGTNVAVAIQKAGQLLKRDAAPDSMRHVILLTDGRVDSYQAHEARQMADQLADEQRHVSLFAYGVGRGVDRAELLHIIGGPPTCPLPPTAAAANATAAAAATAAAGAAGPQVQAVPAAGAAAAEGAAGSSSGSSGSGGGSGGSPTGMSLSAWDEPPEDRYLALCVRDEPPW
uniref:VWFA domain-containing protein n=1 Tax=Pleodorina starrii TaxID=330485 RepID=A0A9W6BVQ4_9CHLO|nr:hypothetical protein PLESTM_000643100 [Pleodorina starrii]GLC59299.1 hypothetical protein PLESTB_001471800 [Pleodorina starrii]GLC74502.1 hypothetical protein PLESTF_001519500 [Pleodorina starrii]